jgi:hypothetical protein
MAAPSVVVSYDAAATEYGSQGAELY